MRILADQNIPGLHECFGHMGELRAVEGRRITPADLRAVDVLLVRSVTRVDAALLRNSPVRFVGSATAGLDHVDIDWLRAAGIAFAAAPGANANAVVEYVLAAIAAQPGVLERLLAGGRAGIIGYGHVGQLLRARLTALGIASLQYDPWLPAGTVPEPAPLASVLACDVISLHTSLTRAAPWPSYHLLGHRQLAQLDAGSLLINASRGEVIDSAALQARLEASDAPRCVLDVWEFEPEVSPALLERVDIGTPHIAGYSLDAKLTATRQLARALQQALGAQEQASPLTAVPETLQLPPHLRGVDVLRWLCAARYDIHADDSRLREVVFGAPVEQARHAFDHLRKTYPVRRELAGSYVAAANTDQVEWVKALGAVVV